MTSDDEYVLVVEPLARFGADADEEQTHVDAVEFTDDVEGGVVVAVGDDDDRGEPRKVVPFEHGLHRLGDVGGLAGGLEGLQLRRRFKRLRRAVETVDLHLELAGEPRDEALTTGQLLLDQLQTVGLAREIVHLHRLRRVDEQRDLRAGGGFPLVGNDGLKEKEQKEQHGEDAQRHEHGEGPDADEPPDPEVEDDGGCDQRESSDEQHPGGELGAKG